MDAFISHSSADATLASRIEKRLEREGLTAWLDRSEIRIGALLRDELYTSIEQSRAIVLLWSKRAAASRWVAAELLTAFHLGRFVIACALDDTRLPQFLESTIWLDFRTKVPRQLESLCRAVREAPGRTTVPLPVPNVRSPELQQMIDRVAAEQSHELDLLERWDVDGARQVHSAVDGLVRPLEKRWRFDIQVQKLGAYHRKNAYMVKHWEAINGGRTPKDPLLLRAERSFFATLFLNPLDYEALNGLASILVLERELSAAAFFNERAIRLARRDGVEYAEAKHDREVIRNLRRSRPGAARTSS
jgi:hypothetical protein